MSRERGGCAGLPWRSRTSWATRDLLRSDVDDIVRDFIGHERQHIVKEESILFPAALNALQPADWADVALQLADRYDPLNPPSLEEKYDALRRTILKIGDEAELQRLR